MRDYYEQLYGNKIDNLEEMDRSLEKFNLLRLNQKETEIMNNPITSPEIEAVIKNLPKKQKPRTRWLHRRILSNIQRRTNAYPSKTLSKYFKRRNSFYQATITLTPKPDKDNTKKENYRSISLMNIGAKILNKIQQTEFSNTSKSSYTMTKLGLFQGCKDSSIYTNQCYEMLIYTILTN